MHEHVNVVVDVLVFVNMSLIASPAIPDMLSNISLPITLPPDILVTNYF